MGQKKFLDLATDSTYDAGLYVIVKKDGMPEAKRLTLATVVSDEAATREAADNAIIDGVGLEADATFAPIETSEYLKTADFEDASLDSTVKNALVLLDEAIAVVDEAVSGFSDLTNDIIKISSTSQRRLNSEPVTVIDCPEDGVIHVVDCVAFLDYSGGALNCGEGATLDLRYSGGGGIGSWTNGFLTATADTRQKMKFDDNHALIVGDDVELYTSGDDSGGVSTSDIYLYIVYQILSA